VRERKKEDQNSYGRELVGLSATLDWLLQAYLVSTSSRIRGFRNFPPEIQNAFQAPMTAKENIDTLRAEGTRDAEYCSEFTKDCEGEAEDLLGDHDTTC